MTTETTPKSLTDDDRLRIVFLLDRGFRWVNYRDIAFNEVWENICGRFYSAPRMEQEYIKWRVQAGEAFPNYALRFELLMWFAGYTAAEIGVKEEVITKIRSIIYKENQC